LTMESPVLFTSKISPVCLPPIGSNDQYTDKDAAVIGWGALKEGSYIIPANELISSLNDF
jgi:hypothetical protein